MCVEIQHFMLSVAPMGLGLVGYPVPWAEAHGYIPSSPMGDFDIARFFG